MPGDVAAVLERIRRLDTLYLKADAALRAYERLPRGPEGERAHARYRRFYAAYRRLVREGQVRRDGGGAAGRLA